MTARDACRCATAGGSLRWDGLKPGWTGRARDDTHANAVAWNHAGFAASHYRPDQAKRYLANKLVSNTGATGVSHLRRDYENPLWLLLATTGLVL